MLSIMNCTMYIIDQCQHGNLFNTIFNHECDEILQQMLIVTGDLQKILVHLGQLGCLLAFEGEALLVEDLGDSDDEVQPLVDLCSAQSRGLAAGEPQVLSEASWLVPCQRPGDTERGVLAI